MTGKPKPKITSKPEVLWRHKDRQAEQQGEKLATEVLALAIELASQRCSCSKNSMLIRLTHTNDESH